MAMRDPLLLELDQEMARTRAVLAAVPEVHAAFRPHPKSWTLGELATHIANLLHWIDLTLTTREYDLAPTDRPAERNAPFRSMAATLQRFDEQAAGARSALAVASDSDLGASWTLKRSGQALFSLPRVACLRAFVFNHLIHHRGQLTVYLRLCDLPVPELYGPTADSAGAPGAR